MSFPFQPGLIVGRGALDAAAAPASVIQSIQQGSITIGAAANSNTATISSVNTAKSILIWNGSTTTVATQTQGARYAARIDLTNSTTVTATRENSSDAVTVAFTVVEFASGVNSIQQGTIVLSAIQTTNTATISAVGANAFVLLLGATTAGVNLDFGLTQAAVELTNSTTVTASCFLGAAMTVGYMVVDLDSTIINSVQKVAKTDATGSTSYTSTISSVTPANTVLFYNGFVAAGSLGTSAAAITSILTNGTTVTFTRVGTAATSRTSYLTVVEFKSAILSGGAQRGTIAIAAANSNTATLSPAVTTAKTMTNWNNFRATTANANVVMPSLALTNTTTVTASVGSAGSPTIGYETLEFA